MPICRSTLAEIRCGAFSGAARKALTGRSCGAQFPAALPYTREDVLAGYAEPGVLSRMSLSGAQTKCSLVLRRGKLTLRNADEVATHLLKPVPEQAGLAFRKDVPANEHLTMQLAGQLFGIRIAPNALLDLADGSKAYVVLRFDRTPEGTRRRLEDFCQLMDAPDRPHGGESKYEGSYEWMGEGLKRLSRAPLPDLREYFRRVVFDYAFANGDAHRKNFALLEYAPQDYRLSPAYDLLCTTLHLPNEARMALDLFKDGAETAFFADNGFYGRPDFLLFAERLGIPEAEASAYMDRFPERAAEVEALVRRSFLSAEAQERYLAIFRDRLMALRP